MLTFHVMGDWGPGEISCQWAESSFAPAADVREMIEGTWARLVGRPGVHLFDGPMCRLESFRATDSEMRLVLSRTSYKAFVGTNMYNPGLARERGWGALANPVGLSCALVSSDEKLVLGKRNESVAYYPGRIHPFAGAMEPREPMDVFAEVRRELAEELAFAEADMAEMRCLGLVEDAALRQPELVFLVRSTRGLAEIEGKLDETEHHGCWAVEAMEGSVGAELERLQRFTPVGVATMLLWARERMGVDAFERLRGRIGAG